MIRVRKEIVEHACKRALEHIQKTRDRYWEEAVCSEIETPRIAWPYFWRRMRLNREQAERAVQEQTHRGYKYFLNEGWIWYGWRLEDIAKELLSAIAVCEDDTVQLTSKQAAMVNNWNIVPVRYKLAELTN